MCYINHLFIVLLFTASYCFAQSNFESLGESGVAFNKKFSNNFKMNYATKARYFLYKNNGFNFENRQIDLLTFSTLNLNYNKSISIGVQYRFRENFGGKSNELRLTQQYNYTKKNLIWRFGHRVRAEQRIFNDVIIFRQRYRFAMDRALNGEQINVGEGYIVVSMEGLLSISKTSHPEFDHRTTTQIGIQVSEKMKLQLGVQYRFEAFNIAAEEKLFLLSGLIVKL